MEVAGLSLANGVGPCVCRRSVVCCIGSTSRGRLLTAVRFSGLSCTSYISRNLLRAGHEALLSVHKRGNDAFVRPSLSLNTRLTAGRLVGLSVREFARMIYARQFQYWLKMGDISVLVEALMSSPLYSMPAFSTLATNEVGSMNARIASIVVHLLSFSACHRTAFAALDFRFPT